MALQNRVTPFGEIVAIPQRGLFTGNRGIIHDPLTRVLLRRRWASRSWLICTCDYQGRRREVMATRSWTELFFLDEAVALAAGHRPCFLCRRADAERFRNAWSMAAGSEHASAPHIDTTLHHERVEHGQKRLHPIPMAQSDLPDGTMIAANSAAFAIYKGNAYRWTSEGYAAREDIAQAAGMLTPPSTYRAFAAGYRPVLHPSIGTPADG
ncbi:MAG: hypothetical protein P0Y59_11465 [Candidatus Sphingomonas phytovorans]|nr:hypothetical protein [Sphingomonas sp.]WEK02265.1 MAG: hypothetical protein P0Y59_11465 [Sphingomonas sp.]